MGGMGVELTAPIFFSSLLILFRISPIPIPDPLGIFISRSGASGTYLHTHRAGNCTGGERGADAAAKEDGESRGLKDTFSIDITRGRFVNNSSAALFTVSLAVVFRSGSEFGHPVVLDWML